MAKTRAQRKAERRRREQAQRQQQGDGSEQQQESKAQHDTQAPVSGDVAEAEAVIETGARTEDYGEHVGEQPPDSAQARAAVPGVTPEPVVPEQAPPEPEAPAPSRADVGQPPAETPGETREQRRARKKAEKEAEKEQRRRERTRELQKAQAEKAEKRRGGVIGFFQSCWAELKKVQWPDRDTLVQASAVTLIFVAIMAAYLGALDAAFNWMIKQII
jgi:preprotein translocase subunit SecE